MSRNWTTDPFSDLSSEVQSAVLNRDQIDTAHLNIIQELFDVVCDDLCDLTAFPPQSSSSRETLSKKRTWLSLIYVRI